MLLTWVNKNYAAKTRLKESVDHDVSCCKRALASYSLKSKAHLRYKAAYVNPRKKLYSQSRTGRTASDSLVSGSLPIVNVPDLLFISGRSS